MLAAHLDDALDAPLTLDALDALARLLWRAWGAGSITDADAERLEGLLRARRDALGVRVAKTARRALDPLSAPLRPRSPDRAASIARRRRLAASGALPPEIAAHFTTGEVAVLAVVGREAARGRPCDWPMDRIAAVAGVSRTVARGALRLAQRLGLLRVHERRRSATRSLTNLVTLTGRSWRAWLRRGGGGCGKPKPSDTQRHTQGRGLETNAEHAMLKGDETQRPLPGGRHPPPGPSTDGP